MAEPEPGSGGDLRRRAEARLERTGEALGAFDPVAMRRLVHDLRVHQVELEIQNEELRAAHERLEASRRRYQDLFHQAPVGYVSIDPAGLVIQANRTFQGMVGRSPDGIVGRPFAALVDERDRPVFLARLRAFFRDPQGKQMTVRLAAPDPEPIHVQIRGRSAGPGSGEPATDGGDPHLLLTVSDVTRQRRAEEAIQRAKTDWEATFDAVQELVAVIDADHRIVRANRALARRARLPLEACIGRPCYELFHGTSVPPPLCPHRRSLEEGRPLKVEFHEEMLGGHFLVSVAPLGSGPDGRPRLVHVAHDITELKRAEDARLNLERQVQQAQKMQSLNTMAGAIAHRFNNLLGAVLGRLDLLKIDLAGDPRLRHDLSEIEAAARQAAKISQTMLTYVGQTWSRHRPVDAAALLRGMLPLVEESLPSHIGFEARIDDGLPPVVADASQIEQAVMNLIINAWEALGDRPGRIRLALTAGPCGDGAFLPPDELADVRCVFVRVEDDGPGMDDATRSRVFDPFFTTKFTGRGLGLSVTQGIVKAHGGFIDLNSAPGRGTVVTVVLPAAADAATERTAS